MRKYFILLPIAVLLLFAPKAHAAITFDASSTSAFITTNATTTWTHTVTGSNPVMLAELDCNSVATVAVGNFTYNGAPLTQLGVNNLPGFPTDNQIFYYLKNPSSGSNTFSITTNAGTASGNCKVYATDFTGVDQTTPIDATSTASGTGSSPASNTITTGFANDVVFDWADDYDFAITASSSQTTIYNASGQPNSYKGMGYVVESSTGAHSIRWTYSGSSGTGWYIEAVALKAAPTVTFNNTNTMQQVSSNSFSGSMSVTAGGSNTVAFAVVAFDNSAGAALTSATYGGKTMTSAGSAAGPGGSNNYAQVFYLVNPPTGSNTLSITGNANVNEMYVNLVSFNNVSQTSPVRPGTYASSSGTTATGNQTLTITSNPSDLTLSVIDMNGGDTSNWTLDGNNTGGTLAGASDHSTVGSSTVAHNWTNGGSSAGYAIAGFSIQAASGGGGGTATPPPCYVMVVSDDW